MSIIDNSSGDERQNVSIRDSRGYEARADGVTETLMTVDYEHHEIHEGSHFFIRDFNEAAANGIQEFLIITPNTTKWSHLLFAVEHEGEGSVIFLETVTTAAAGASVTPLNNNRNIVTAATLEFQSYTSSITLTAGATILAQDHKGSGKKFGGGGRSGTEIVLKQNTKYLLRITDEAGAANLLNWEFSWYEHTSRN